MKWWDVRGSRGREWRYSGRHLAEAITGVYLVCGLAWMLVALHWVNHDRQLIMEDSVYVLLTAAVLYGLLRRGIGVLRDKEAALRESEDRLARILETNASGIVVFDKSGAISYTNHAASAMLGEERENLLGKRYDDPAWGLTTGGGLPLNPADSPVGAVRRSLLPVYDQEFGILRRDGSRIFLTTNAAPFLDASGTVIGIVASFVDITERKKSEEMKVRKLLLAVEQSPSAIAISDLRGNLEYANRRHLAMSGWSSRDVVDGNLPEEEVIDLREFGAMREAALSGEPWHGEILCRRGGGEVRWEAASVTPIRTPEGEVASLLWVREDITERKLAEAALRRSEAYYRAVVEDQTELICRFRTDGTLTFVNEAFCRYFGKPREQLLGSPFLGARADQDSVGMARRWASGDRNFPPIEYEIQVTSAAGYPRWQRWTERAVFDSSGGFVEFQAVGADVTEHRQADVALEESRERFRNLVETISDCVWEVNQVGTYTYVSPRVRTLLGYEPGEVLGKSPAEFVHDAGVPRMNGMLAELMSRHEPFRGLELGFRRKDGGEALIETNGAPFFDADGAFRGYRGVSRDIGERKRAEELLRASEERFRQLFEQNEEPLFICRHGCAEILDANPAAESLYGYPRQELVGQSLALFAPEEDREALASAVAGIRPDAPLVIPKASHRRKGGEEVIVSIRAKSVQTREELVSYCSFRDITGRIRMEEEAKLQQAKLIHANRMTTLGAIVSGVAHEINNPNNLVMFNAPLLHAAWEDVVPILDACQREGGDFSCGGLPYTEMREVLPKLAAGISDASRRIKAIVENLKDFARQEEPHGRRPERVNDIVRSAVTILRHEIMKRTRRFETELGEDLPMVMGAAQQLEQVVINLLQNALQSLSSSDQSVRVATARDAATGDVEVRIVDEGIGMSRDTLSRITEPFFSTRLESGGLGLGLSISQSIVSGHGGELRFESDVGKGTAAVIRLPAYQPPAQGGADEPSAQVPVRR